MHNNPDLVGRNWDAACSEIERLLACDEACAEIERLLDRVAELEAGITRVRNDLCYRWRRHRDDDEPFSESVIVEEFADLMTHPDAEEEA